MGLQLLAGSLLGAGHPLEHAVAIEQHQRQGEEPHEHQVDDVGVAIHEAGHRQFAVAPLVTHHGELVGGDGEDGLVEDPHQHPLSGQAGKPHPDRLVIGGAGDAQGALGIIVQRMAGKIEGHDGGIHPSLGEHLHRFCCTLHLGDAAALQSLCEGHMARHRHRLARQTPDGVDPLFLLAGEDHIDVVGGVGHRGAQPVVFGHLLGDGADEVDGA